MPLFLCRWPNGDCSIVLARNPDDAMIKLDEIADPEDCSITPLRSFEAHFSLTDEGDLALECFGGDTRLEVFGRAYPALDAAMRGAYNAVDAYEYEALSPHGQAIITKAVEAERSRLSGQERQAPKPQTELGRFLKDQTGMPTVLIERLVSDAATKTLKRMKPGGKPH